MDAGELHILQHSLGLDQYGRGTFYRNHFCTGEGSLDHPVCMSLVDQGFMTRRANIEMFGGMDMFYVTPLGRDAAVAHSPKPPKLVPRQATLSGLSQRRLQHDIHRMVPTENARANHITL